MGFVADLITAMSGTAPPLSLDSAMGDELSTSGPIPIIMRREDGHPPARGARLVAERAAETIAAALAAIPAPEDIPEGWRFDSAGRLVREIHVSDADRLRDEVALSYAVEGLVLHELLADYKARALGDLADLVAESAKRYGVEIGGEKGNLSVTTYDGKWRVQRVYRDVISFTEEILAAKVLIDGCIKRWSEGANPHISALIDRAFRANQKGDLRTGPVLELLRTRIEDPEWKRAMEALADSIEVSGSAVYIRVYERVAGDAYRPITLDLAVA